jgi:hypothetical protein
MLKRGLLALLRRNLFSAVLIITLFLITSLTATEAKAQSTASQVESGTIVNTQILSPTSPHTASLAIYNFSHAVSCILTGSSPIAPCLEYKFTKNLQGVTSAIPYLPSVNTSHGLLGMSASFIDSLYVYRPLNKSEYLTDLGRSIGLTREANAQVGGSGNAVLSPVFKLWEVTRNITYLAMILIFVVVGLMVMFRQKLNPQTVVSIQLALPGLVIGLILITFSYFFAALITDLAFLGTDLVGYYFQTASGSPSTSLTYELGSTNALRVGGHFIGVVKKSQLDEAATQLLEGLPPASDISWSKLFTDWDGLLVELTNPRRLVTLMIGFIAFQFGQAIGGVLGGLAGLTAGLLGKYAFVLTGAQGVTGPLLATGLAAMALGNPTSFLGFTLYFIAVFAILYTLLRLALALINNYLQIIFLTITAPFHFLVASLPGKQGVAVTWMRNMLCHVLAFPAVIAVFYFAAFMVRGSSIPGLTVVNAPQIASTHTLPLFGGIDLSLVQALLAFGAILATPKIPEIICRAIGKPSQAGGAVDQTIIAGIGSGQKYSGQFNSGLASVPAGYNKMYTEWKGKDPWSSTSEKFWAQMAVNPRMEKFGLTGTQLERHDPEEHDSWRAAAGGALRRGFWNLARPASTHDELRAIIKSGGHTPDAGSGGKNAIPKAPTSRSLISGSDKTDVDDDIGPGK